MGDSDDAPYHQAKPLALGVPQLSCALCRDRKLKCDKLDPCTNCTSSGAVCVPIHRPRLPRGRHARRTRPKTASTAPPPTNETGTAAPTAAASSDLTARVHRLESLVRRGEAANASKAGIDCDAANTNTKTNPNTNTVDHDLSHRIRRLESLVQGISSTTGPAPETCSLQDQTSAAEPLSSSTVREHFHKKREIANEPMMSTRHLTWSKLVQIVRSVEDSDLMQVDAPIFPSPTRWSPEFSAWADLIDDETHEPVDKDRPSDVVKSDISALGLLGSHHSLSASPLGPFYRDKVVGSQLCQVYLQNVDPIIKILHRPCLRRWMIDGERYLGYDEDHTSVRALESAVYYAAANTMTESQCQASFHASKSSIVAAHRKRCEGAIESASLLTTRDMIVLQAFVLYLIARRSEEKGTAVWTLVALAVRLTKAMGVNQEPGEAVKNGETFFHQQMRLRLWLTVCLMDLQTSFAESSEPLISHRDVATAVAHVRHINDYDFDVDTAQPVADREELTETTFALVTYRVQIAGRLLNFATPDWSSPSPCNNDIGSDTSSSSFTTLLDPGERQRQARHFQQEALGLLHFCDPESSPYAWFTWHSTQCLVSAIRLSELLPFQYSRLGSHMPSSPQRQGGDTDLLRRTLQSLEKAQLIHSDPRGEGFRWYITTPWLALSIAISECNNCTDTSLVRRAWPIIEASFQQYESFALMQKEQLPQTPLVKLMNRTREKQLALSQDRNNMDESRSANRAAGTSKSLLPPMPTPVSCVAEATPVDPSLIENSSIMAPERSYPTSTQPFVQQAWNPASFSTEFMPALDTTLPTPDMYHPLSSSSSDLFEPSWMTTDIMGLYSTRKTTQLATD
ncbi:VrtR2 [Arthroderma uncinatum]|uniref:VrtR2 n=1 Tax=Arthroderma uncinatum TaxID=74035 RepID=UPI00144AB2D5|nr:VrtR2 [Arthroderma uncinatum]KAF3481325.1 VrtR2 [Arthroderma uncinatum]